MPECHIRLKLDSVANKGLVTYTASHCDEKLTQNNALNWVCCSLLNQEIADLIQDKIESCRVRRERSGWIPDTSEPIQKNIILSDHANRGIKYFITTRYPKHTQNEVINMVCTVLRYSKVYTVVDKYRLATIGKSGKTELDTIQETQNGSTKQSTE